MAEWLGTGLQNLVHRFDSGRRLSRKALETGLFGSYSDKLKQRIPLKWRKEGETRIVPRPKTLDRYLEGLPGAALSNNSILRRAQRDWKASKLEPIELHECRHSYAVWLDAAGISNSRADRYTGHSNRTMGEHYRSHPLTAAQLQADAAALDAYLAAPSAEVVELTNRGQKGGALQQPRKA